MIYKLDPQKNTRHLTGQKVQQGRQRQISLARIASIGLSLHWLPNFGSFGSKSTSLRDLNSISAYPARQGGSGSARRIEYMILDKNATDLHGLPIHLHQ
jgi:hypothetical protein